MAYKKLFIDSDTILDLLLKREPFVNYSKVLMDNKIIKNELYTSALILGNVHYIVTKNKDKRIATDYLESLISGFNVLPFDEHSIIYALDNKQSDFEDAIQYFIANEHNCDAIITRNLKHYKMFDIDSLTAEQYLKTVL